MFRKSRSLRGRRSSGAFVGPALIFVVCFVLFCSLLSARAEIVTTGNVDPTNPATWNASTSSYIGKYTSGTMSITGGSEVLDDHGHIGYKSGTTGEVTVDGNASAWRNTLLDVGYWEGSGTLNITGGGTVTVEEATWVSGYAASSGAIHFDNGTLDTGSLLCAADDLTGTGTIHTHGMVSDVDLVFDATHPLNQVLTMSDLSGQNITIHLNVDGSGAMGAGFSGEGSLRIADGTVINSTSFFGGYIGYKTGATGVVTVEGAGSTWTNTARLQIGGGPYGASGNGTLNITGGGAVANTYCIMGYKAGSTGTVFVDGEDSTWTNSGHLHVGQDGSGTLRITDGGEVTSANDSALGYHSGSTGEVTVEDAGSTWTNSGKLDVGRYGSGTLHIAAGGAVSNTDGLVGDGAGSTGLVTVDGAGSTWTNSGNLYIGLRDDGTMNITDGGAVSNGIGSIGAYAGSLGEVTVEGADSTWTNSGILYVGGDPYDDAGTGTLHITNLGKVSAGGLSIKTGGTVNLHGGTLELTDDTDFFDWDGTFNFTHGEIRVTNGTVSARDTMTLGGNQVLTLMGDDAHWQSYYSYDMDVDNGELHVHDGASVRNDNASIASSTDSIGMVTVAGAGSTWMIRGLCIGERGRGTLNITDGGSISNSSSGEIGQLSGSTGEVTVDGTDSKWSNDYGLTIGLAGGGTLCITGGGEVSNSHGCIGDLDGSVGEVTVDGAGSTWANGWRLCVGDEGSGTLNITGGGQVTVEEETWVGRDSSGAIHFDNGTLTTNGLLCGIDDLTGTGTINTTGLVTDVDLVFDATHGLDQTLNLNTGQDITIHLTVDGSGSMGAGYSFGNVGTMRIADGKVIESDGGYIGYKFYSTGEVTVEGPGSTWTNRDDLYVGYYGIGTLLITDGGTVSNVSGCIGRDRYLAAQGQVTVEGPGSTWTNSADLKVGSSGHGALNILGGGMVSTQSSYIGVYSGSTGVVTVDGNDSTWTTQEELRVGDSGDGTLLITGGGAVTNVDSYLGYSSTATGVVTVDGAGSTWTNTGSYYFVIGHEGSGTLNITGGGEVSNSYCFMGYSSGASGTVTVDGCGSTWTNSDNLFVGFEGNGTLHITGGGVVSSNAAGIGYESGSTGKVVVDGIGSMWTNNGLPLYVGSSGDGTLHITGGGAVFNSDGYIGYPYYSTGTVTVNGEGSTWTNSGSLSMGSHGNGTLTILDGGLVQVAGTLSIDNNADGEDFLNMAGGGMLALFGEADDSLLDFLGLVEGTDAIRWWDGSLDEWALLSTATAGTDYLLEYLTEGELAGYTLLTVTAPGPLPGDLNDDGFVGGDDLDIVRSFWGQSVTAGDPLWGDPSGDGFVGGDDLDIVRANWGQGTPPSPVSVPEPSVLTGLLTLCLAGIWPLRRPG